ncbi:hypothetical protein ZIOFF_071847 [Zingiber officinale]|uniref:DUF4216 domain-containing protein n=1 Tax=Zingiber officinale TaxID=94328 RepID=A0A8J5C8V0_ZINOF|nr:hypothetical protein ZIOFF_071847 [Zingiber officinale]
METFAEWLSKQVSVNSLGRIQWLAHGPRKHVTSYIGYIVNGYRFHTIDVRRSTQDSGVSIEADTIYQSNANDDSHTVGRLSYYGIIRDIILLDYYSFKVPIFRCDWANPGTGIKIEDGFTLVNLHQGLKTFESDPFILALQAKQVFYSRDNDESNWYVLLKASPRGIHNMNALEEDAYTSSTPLDVYQLEINITEKEPYSRNEYLHGKEPIVDEKIDKKKGRGASKLKMVSGQDKCKELERNEFGQPIGDNSVKYASFLGCMIKEFVSYTLDGGSVIDEEVKDRMWSCLQIASGDICSGIGNEFGSNSDINIGAKKSDDFGNVFQSNLRNVSRGDICANTKCKLLHWSADELVVAEAPARLTSLFAPRPVRSPSRPLSARRTSLTAWPVCFARPVYPTGLSASLSLPRPGRPLARPVCSTARLYIPISRSTRSVDLPARNFLLC